MEDKNFALFNYVKELTTQINTLQDQIADVKKEIRRFEEQGVKLESQRQKLADSLERKRTQTDHTATEYQDKTQTTRKVLDQCRIGRSARAQTTRRLALSLSPH